MAFLEGTVTVGEKGGRGVYLDTEALIETLTEVGDRHGATVQAFDGRYVASRQHLRQAVELADRARERDEAIARDRAVEILLYAAGRRQIDRALEMGVGSGETPVVVLVDGGDESAAATELRKEIRPGSVEPSERRLRSFFEIGDAELAATDAGIEALVLERVALLVVDR
ncbi:MAG: KEOPS complex subunit Cgi121 [Natronomonas sp.]